MNLQGSCKRLSLDLFASISRVLVRFEAEGLSVRLYSAGVASGPLGPGVQLLEVAVTHGAAEPRFTKVDGASQKERVCPGGGAAPVRNIDAAPPSPFFGGAPHKRAALLSEEPAQGGQGGGVVAGARGHTFQTANASYKHTNCRSTGVQHAPSCGTNSPKSLLHTARRTSASEQARQATGTDANLNIFISPEDRNKMLSSFLPSSLNWGGGGD